MSDEKKINVKLLRRVKQMILDEPRRLNMSHFAAMFKDSVLPTVDIYEDITPPKEERPPCGAVMCIAGHSLLADEQERGIFRKRFTKKIVNRINQAAEGEAQKLLGITDGQAERLFYFKGWGMMKATGWPRKFSDAYLAAETPTQRARITARRIERFIRTKGEE